MFDVISPPLLTADLPGIGGRIKSVPEDFEVEEIPAYEPSGNGDFLYLWLEKRDLGAEYFTRQIARRLNLPNGEVGTAGLKDRRAVTRQWVSVPAGAEAQLGQLEGDGIRVLKTSRHSNKLRPGHLHGNRFRILVRDIDPAADATLAAYLERLRAQGFPNYYGPQRFGKNQETLQLGMSLLGAAPMKRVSPFLKKLALSAVQSALFNQYLGERLRDGLLFTVLHGDVMAKIPFGGMFVAEDVAAEQRRFDAKEIVHAGPIFGRKTFPARHDAAEREQATLARFGLSSQSFSGFGKLLQGTRRHNLVYVPDLEAEKTSEGVRLSFTLPAGSYATVLLREIMKVDDIGDEESP
ncbi:MAG: tRNA pseudouridine(13) synthase TruD [Gemmataceae bacterium]|nr:tRNA pseudouridine(13) synthase TruD [Gemmataceae bacterium]MCI0741920.1 tRNA pseudouridine(13) synthase TruD [Gemmataceae bacterium]